MIIVAIGILVGVNISKKSTLKAGIVLSLLNCSAVCCSPRQHSAYVDERSESNFERLCRRPFLTFHSR